MHYRGNALPKRTPRFWRGVIAICIVFCLHGLWMRGGMIQGKCFGDGASSAHA